MSAPTDIERARAYYERQHLDPNNETDAAALTIEFAAIRYEERARLQPECEAALVKMEEFGRAAGRVENRTQIVAWLRSAGRRTRAGWTPDGQAVRRQIADAIERGDYQTK